MPALARLLAEGRSLTATPGSTPTCGFDVDGTAIVARTVDAGDRLELARRAGALELVAMGVVHRAVNEVLALGATPKAFLLHAGGFDAGELEEVFAGVVRGCRGAYAPLVGAGPLGEGPVLAGTLVGAAAPGTRLDGSRAARGDVVFGIASTGFHADDFAETSRTVAELGLGPQDPLPGAGTTVARALLAPAKTFRGVLLRPIAERWVSSLAHVAQGGLAGALARLVPAPLRADVRPGSWEVPELFARFGYDGAARFNLGLGMLAAVPREHAERFAGWIAAWNERCWPIGEVSDATATGSATPGSP